MMLRSFLYIFFKDRPFIFAVFLLAIILSLLWCIAAPPVFRGEARLLVSPLSSSPSPLDQYRPEAFRMPPEERARATRDEMELLKGQHLTEAVMVRLKNEGVLPSPDNSLLHRIEDFVEPAINRILIYLNMVPGPIGPEERMAADFHNALCVRPVRGTDLISVAFYWTDPRVAALAANAYADEYLAGHIRFEDAQETYRAYSDQAEVTANKLTEVEERLKRLEAEAHLPGEPLRKEIMEASISDLRRRYERADLDLARIQAWIERLAEEGQRREGWVETPASGLPLGNRQSYLKSLDDSYLILKDERERMARLYPADAIEIRALDTQIAKLRDLKIESLRGAASVDLSEAEERKAALARQIAIEKRGLEEAGIAAATREQLEGERNALEKEYRVYKDKAEALRRNARLEAQPAAELKIASLAAPPLVPASFPKELIVLFSGLAGLIVGFALSAIHQCSRHTFRGADDVARNLSVPLLLTVPLTAAPPIEAPGLEGKAAEGPDRLQTLLGVDLRRPVMTPGDLAYGVVIVVLCFAATFASSHLQYAKSIVPTLSGIWAHIEAVSSQGLPASHEADAAGPGAASGLAETASLADPLEKTGNTGKKLMDIESELDKITAEMESRAPGRTGKGNGSDGGSFR